MRVWVLARESNFDSYENQRFLSVAKENNIDLSMVSAESFDLIVTKGGKKSVLYKGEGINLPDFLLPRRGSSSTYFTLAVIRHLEKLDIFSINSSQSIETAKDKLATMQMLAAKNIPIPKTLLARFPLNLDMVEKELSFPVILKTVSGSKGKGVLLCENRAQLEDVGDLMEISKDPKVNVILQEFVSTSRGRDIRVIVVGGRPIGAMLRTARDGRIKANVHAGGSVSRLDLNPEIEWLAVESAKTLGLDIAGVDLLFDEGSYKVAEVNSSPGFSGFEQATVINVPQEIFNYLKIRSGGSI